MPERIREKHANEPLRILVAPDKFKGSLSAKQVARSVIRGFRTEFPTADFDLFELADGGEGFRRSVVECAKGSQKSFRTIDAIGRPVRAEVGFLRSGATAVIDIASASGLARLSLDERDPCRTSTEGTGRLIDFALKSGCSDLVVGLGGSATNDGGIGLAAAIGFQFLAKTGRPIPLTGAGLLELEHIIAPETPPKIRVVAATDVDNPLLGVNGAARRYAKQKGAGPAAVARLESALRNLERIVKRDLGKDFAKVPGAGAAGGCGYGLLVFFGAQIRPGFEIVAGLGGLAERVPDADLVVTGEGRFDVTSMAGKGPTRLAALCRKSGVTIVAVFGKVASPRAGKIFDDYEVLPRISEAAIPIITPKQHAKRVKLAASRLARRLAGLR